MHENFKKGAADDYPQNDMKKVDDLLAVEPYEEKHSAHINSSFTDKRHLANDLNMYHKLREQTARK